MMNQNDTKPIAVKEVVLVGMLEPYRGSAENTEVWCVNRAFMAQNQEQAKAARVYFFDKESDFAPDFIQQVNQLKNTRVIARRHWDKVEASEPYPYEQVVSYFNGAEYFSCGPSYMLAQAIMEGFETIHLVGMYWLHDSAEYILHKPCMDFWCGLAMGMGRNLRLHGETQLLRPWPWSSKKYGYVVQANEGLVTQIMAGSYRACLGYPVHFCDADDPQLATTDQVDHSRGLARSIIDGHEIPTGTPRASEPKRMVGCYL